MLRTLHSYLVRLVTEETYHSPLPICCGHFSPNNSRQTPIAHPTERAMGVSREFEVEPKFYFRSYCVRCNNVLYCTAVYWVHSTINAIWMVYNGNMKKYEFITLIIPCEWVVMVVAWRTFDHDISRIHCIFFKLTWWRHDMKTLAFHITAPVQVASNTKPR